LGVALHIVKPVVHFQKEIVVVVNWDMKVEKETLTELNARLSCAASRKENLKPVPIALIIPLAE